VFMRKFRTYQSRPQYQLWALLLVRSFCVKDGTINHHSIFPNLFRFSRRSSRINLKWRMAAVLLSVTADYEVNIYPEPVQLRYPKTPWKYITSITWQMLFFCVAWRVIPVSKRYSNTDAYAWRARLVICEFGTYMSHAADFSLSQWV
jgi:hypothetical protein